MKENIRNAVLQLGADVCGFAGAEGFTQAPKTGAELSAPCVSE